MTDVMGANMDVTLLAFSWMEESIALMRVVRRGSLEVKELIGSDRQEERPVRKSERGSPELELRLGVLRAESGMERMSVRRDWTLLRVLPFKGRLGRGAPGLGQR